MKSQLFCDPQFAAKNLIALLHQTDLVDVRALGAQPHPKATPEVHEIINSEDFHKLLNHRLEEQRSHFLGAYAETLWHCYLDIHPRYELIKRGLQVHHQGKTIGEFDFLVQDLHTEDTVHQELALKFYLALPGLKPSQQTLWFGPNNIDRLDKKCRHLRDNQLVFGTNQAAKLALEELGIKTLKSECILRGRLFVPFNQSLRERLVIPDIHTKNNATGLWYSWSEFQNWTAEHPHTLYSLLEKPQWISASDLQLSTMLSASQMTEHLLKKTAEGKRAVMLQQYNEHSGLRDAMFVVPDDWAEKSYRSTGDEEA